MSGGADGAADDEDGGDGQRPPEAATAVAARAGTGALAGHRRVEPLPELARGTDTGHGVADQLGHAPIVYQKLPAPLTFLRVQQRRFHVGVADSHDVSGPEYSLCLATVHHQASAPPLARSTSWRAAPWLSISRAR